MNRQFVFKALTPHLIALAVLFTLNALFFTPQFQGKVPRQGDIVSWEAASKEIKDYETKTGRITSNRNLADPAVPAPARLIPIS